tara:strand:+ start:51179 stop:51472 length:294 start_codon:yes stop_codon:yes gene_type:complete
MTRLCAPKSARSKGHSETECHILNLANHCETRRNRWHAPCNPQDMMNWTILLLLVALVAAVFGFGGIAASAAGMAKIVFIVALVLAAVGFVAGQLRK